MLSEILSYLGDRIDVEVGALCLSTEEMCGNMEAYNIRAPTTRCPVIFSMDVIAMFPNLQHEGVARTCREEFLKSDLTIEEVDTKALGIYIAILYQDRKEELEALSLSQVVPRRVHLRAKKILITTEEVLEPGEKTTSKFLPREQLPTKEQEKLLLALEQGILATFKHHYYSFDQGVVRLQGEGGPIGLKISGTVGKVASGHASMGEGVQGQDERGHQHPPRHGAVPPPDLRG